ncbi:aspartyl protease family protein [Novosphingobium rosa]|uniref:aspartyl protease family protein n=1 Tax=Novosphingobium rosa TaxID=76978 RepID=UPI0008364B92|nr:aspartyl protease family protein [Novosphingobium rosa]
MTIEVGKVSRGFARMMMVALLTSGVGVSSAYAADCTAASYGTLPVEMIGGRATTMVKINGKDMRFILDTGAFFSIMSRATAQGLGLPLQMTPPGFYIQGIGGKADASIATVRDFGILGANLHNIQFLVGGSDAGTGLLGSNLLNIFDLDADLSQGKATLIRTSGCGSKASLAYWAKDGNYNEAPLLSPKTEHDRSSRVTVFVNGKPVIAELDTGATTLITRKAAERVGIDMHSAAVTPGGFSRGFGQKTNDAWNARVALYQVGTETIQNSHMRVIDGEFDTNSEPTEMLLGIDFFLSHHIFIAHSQRKVYFTYNGARPSVLDKASQVSAASKPAPAADAAELQDAQAIGLRGQAHLSRGEFAEGMADLDKAIAMAPDAPASAGFYFERAKAKLARGSADKGESALSDLDASLRLAPDRSEVLLTRARVLIRRHERDKADADLAAAGRALTPGSQQTLTLAGLLIDQDRPLEAIPLLDTWVKLHGEDANLPSALNTRCWARGLAGTQLPQAQEDCRKAIKGYGEKPALLDSAGLVQLRMGQYQQAVDFYTKSLAGRADNGWALYGRALAKLHLGQEAGKAELAAVRLSHPVIVARAEKLGLTPP